MLAKPAVYGWIDLALPPSCNSTKSAVEHPTLMSIHTTLLSIHIKPYSYEYQV